MKHPNILICSAEDALRFVLSHFSDPNYNTWVYEMLRSLHEKS